MRLSGSTVQFSREDAARILNLPLPHLNDLVRRLELGIRPEDDMIPAENLEAFLRDRFLALYQAEAMASMSVPAPQLAVAPAPTLEVVPLTEDPQIEFAEETEEPLVVHSIAEFEAAVRRHRSDLRIATRYTPRRQFGGFFCQNRFTVLQISSTGLRIRHDKTLLPGDIGKLTVAIQKPPRTFAMQAKVVWTSIAQREKGSSFCVTGLRVTEGEDQLRLAIDLLRAARDLQVDKGALRPRATAAAAPALTGLSDDEVASIIRTVRLFESDPVEANRWYTRARFALSDEKVRKAAPPKARDREEAIGVWEYLERKLDLRKIAGVVLWLQQTRSASA
jgi:PilZ domain-containing protein